MWSGMKKLIKAGQQNSAGPVVDHAIAALRIEMGAHDDSALVFTRASYFANDVRLFRPFYALLMESVSTASRVVKQRLEALEPLGILPMSEFQVFLEDGLVE
jgi:hypothetical protein